MKKRERRSVRRASGVPYPAAVYVALLAASVPACTPFAKVKMKRRSLLALVLLFSLFFNSLGQTQRPSAPAQPQQQQQDRSADDEVVRITTNLVQVDLTVTDKSGQAVTDLRPEEVEILEDDRPQKITNFSYVSLEPGTATAAPKPPAVNDKTAPAVPPVRLRPEQVRRTIALVVDDLSLSFESVHFTRQALKNFVDKQMQPGDLVAIIRTGGGIGALQQFTSDKRQLYAAIERVRYNLQGRGGIGAFAPMATTARDQMEAELKSRGVERESDLSGGNRGADDEFNELREDLFAVGTLGALNYIVQGLRELPGRKSVMLISDGFQIFRRNSRSNETRRSERVLEALRHLTDLANRASVVIYTMDARGLQSLGATAEDSTADMTSSQIEERLSDRRNEFFESQSGLNYLAQQTGGFAVRNTNDLSGGIKRVLEDQKGYYLLAYRPDESTFDPATGRRRFHRLSVKIKRPGLNHRTRTGFYGISDEEAVPPRRTAGEQLLGAISSPFNSSGVALRLTSLFASDPKAGPFLRSILHINASNLTFTDEPDGWHKTVFEVLVLTFGDNGQVIDQLGRTQTIRLRGETYETALRDGFVYNLSVPVKKAGAYQMRAALRDTASSRVGAASQFVEVPDINKGRLTLSGLMMQGYDAAKLQKGAQPAAPDRNSAGGTTPGTQQTEEITSALDPQASPAVRKFKRGMVMQYGYAIYNAKTAPAPQLTTQMRLFREGQLVFTGKVQPLDTSAQTDLKRISAGGFLQIGTDMPPGEYVLQVLVTDALANEKYRTATQWMDFEIVR